MKKIYILMVTIRGNKTAMHKYQKELKRGTLNIIDETIYSIVVLKRNIFFVLLNIQDKCIFYIIKGRVTK